MNDRPFPHRPTGERMTEGQIEDVLSAIRRLVSEEALLAVTSRSQPSPVMPEAPPKLILTAAQRVHAPGGDLQGAVGRIGAAVPAQSFESDVGDPPLAKAEWPASLWDMPPAPEESASLPAGVADAEPLAEQPTDTEPQEPDTALADNAEAAIVEALAPVDNAVEVPSDEDRLRALIRDVLREELQGRMGERITTNVRKLVRAEINRLVALHDAEG